MVRRWLFYAFVVFVMSLTLISVFREIRKIILFNQRAYLLRVRIAELEAENKLLKKKIKLAEDGFLLEKIIREELKMARPGEKVFYFKKGGEKIGTKAGEGKR